MSTVGNPEKMRQVKERALPSRVCAKITSENCLVLLAARFVARSLQIARICSSLGKRQEKLGGSSELKCVHHDKRSKDM
jgi:hypothetical protein